MGDAEVSLIRRAYRAFNRRDLDVLIKLSHPEIEIHTITAVVAGTALPYTGHDGLAAYIRDVEATWDELELTPQEFTELEDGRVVVAGRVRVKRDAARIDSPSTWLWEFEGSLVRRVRILADPETIDTLTAI